MRQRCEDTVELLARWNRGDSGALAAFIERNLPWLRSYARKHLGAELRSREETTDFVQESVLEFMLYGPRFQIESEAQVRKILCRIVQNTLRDRHDWYHARRRAISREQALPSDTVLNMGAVSGSVTRPDEAAHRNEMQAWVRFALELLDPEDRRVIVLRQWDGLSFESVGAELGVSSEAARKRFHRALPVLALKVDQLRKGAMEQAVQPAS